MKPLRDKRGRFVSKNATSSGAIPDFACGYDPYNSIDRWPSGRRSGTVILFSESELTMFLGPTETETVASREFFGPR